MNILLQNVGYTSAHEYSVVCNAPGTVTVHAYMRGVGIYLCSCVLPSLHVCVSFSFFSLFSRLFICPLIKKKSVVVCWCVSFYNLCVSLENSFTPSARQMLWQRLLRCASLSLLAFNLLIHKHNHNILHCYTYTSTHTPHLCLIIHRAIARGINWGLSRSQGERKG